MNSVKKREFTARVSQANRSELVVIMYEIILTDIKTAKEAYAKGDKVAYVGELRNAQKFVLELMHWTLIMRFLNNLCRYISI